MSPLPNAAAVESARTYVQLLHERRLASLDGAGRAPDPRVIKAAEEALRAAEARAEGAVQA